MKYLSFNYSNLDLERTIFSILKTFLLPYFRQYQSDTVI